MMEDKITEDFKQAMKSKEAAKVSTLSFLRSQLKYALIEKKADKLADADVVAVIKKQIKQRQDSIEQYEKGGRQDLADKEKFEMNFLKSYLPAEMSAGDLQPVIEAAIKEVNATSIKDMGNVMKAVMPKVAGQADNKLISEMVKQILSKM